MKYLEPITTSGYYVFMPPNEIIKNMTDATQKTNVLRGSSSVFTYRSSNGADECPVVIEYPLGEIQNWACNKTIGKFRVI